MALCREICRMCWHPNPVGFWVPDELWNDVIPREHRKNVVCITCFARLADEKRLPWEEKIDLYPVSLATKEQDP